MALAAHADQYFVMMMNCNHLISAVKLLDSSLGLESNQHLQTDLSNPTSLPLFRLLSFSLPPAISLSSLLPSLCLPLSPLRLLIPQHGRVSEPEWNGDGGLLRPWGARQQQQLASPPRERERGQTLSSLARLQCAPLPAPICRRSSSLTPGRCSQRRGAAAPAGAVSGEAEE